MPHNVLAQAQRGRGDTMASPGDVFNALLQNLTDATLAFTSFAEEVKMETSLSEEAVEEREMPGRKSLEKKAR